MGENVTNNAPFTVELSSEEEFSLGLAQYRGDRRDLSGSLSNIAGRGRLRDNLTGTA